MLSADEVFELSKQIRLGQLLNNQLDSLRSVQFSRDDELSTMLKIPLNGVRSLIANGKRAQSKLVEKNVRLVIHLAGHYRHRGLPFPDLVQEGMIGLIKAVTRYDPDRGFKFSTYAAFWITNSMLRAISAKSRIVRLPRRLHTAVVKTIKAERQFVSFSLHPFLIPQLAQLASQNEHLSFCDLVLFIWTDTHTQPRSLSR